MFPFVQKLGVFVRETVTSSSSLNHVQDLRLYTHGDTEHINLDLDAFIDRRFQPMFTRIVGQITQSPIPGIPRNVGRSRVFWSSFGYHRQKALIFQDERIRCQWIESPSSNNLRFIGHWFCQITRILDLFHLNVFDEYPPEHSSQSGEGDGGRGVYRENERGWANQRDHDSHRHNLQIVELSAFWGLKAVSEISWIGSGGHRARLGWDDKSAQKEVQDSNWFSWQVRGRWGA